MPREIRTGDVYLSAFLGRDGFTYGNHYTVIAVDGQYIDVARCPLGSQHTQDTAVFTLGAFDGMLYLGNVYSVMA